MLLRTAGRIQPENNAPGRNYFSSFSRTTIYSRSVEKSIKKGAKQRFFLFINCGILIFRTVAVGNLFLFALTHGRLKLGVLHLGFEHILIQEEVTYSAHDHYYAPEL